MQPPLTLLLDRLRRLATRPGEDSDAALLGRFARLRDEEAFAALMARHGPMVLNVCCRVLGDAHAAEDAFQATFLVLACKAGRLRRPGRLPAWLYGVARRVALKARNAAARQHLYAAPAEAAEPPDPRPEPLAVLTARDLLRVLEEEIQKLPGGYRMPVVLCCLEGLSQEEAARRLGWTAGSLKGRLERGRANLRTRVVRRGLTLAATLAAAEVARARSSPRLAGSVARAAVHFTASTGAPPGGVSSEVIALAQRGLQGMYPNKLKVALVLLVTAGVTGSGLGWRRAGTGEAGQANAAQPDAPDPAAGDDRPAGRRAGSLKQAREQLRHIVQEAKERDNALSADVVEARQRLVELEERLREIQAEPLRPSPEEDRLRAAEARLKETMVRVKMNSVDPGASPIVLRYQQELDKVQAQLNVVWEQNASAAQAKIQRIIEMRKQIVRLEERIRTLERERSTRWEHDERRREAATERVELLEGSSSAGGGDPMQRATLRKLDTLQREIAELRREMQRLRAEKKE
jgi:RNA polymerase sigma factor (sigma-70 family)